MALFRILPCLAGTILLGLLFLPAEPAAQAQRMEESDGLARYAAPLEQSVGKALAYLAAKQEANGSFQSGLKNHTGVASLCVMAFLARGHLPGEGPYGEVIDKGIDFVLGGAQGNGLIMYGQGGQVMYAHCISTLMLSEVSGMVRPERQKQIDRVLPPALRLILDAQAIPKKDPHVGGWRYKPNSRDSDISCSGWALLALRSARGNGAAVPKQAIDKAVQYILGLRCKDGGFGYQNASNPGLARTGTALLCLELCGMHQSPATTQAGQWIRKHKPRRIGGTHFYYGLYYCTQGMFQLGGDDWQSWAKSMYDIMLAAQREDGSWQKGNGTASRAGEVYSTAMSALALSVSFRQLPIYQR